ncbi:MAG: glutamate 5-kinase [Arsenophonus sp. ET-DL9-MAG3]
MKNKQTLVIKLGTSVLTGGSLSLNQRCIIKLVRQCVEQYKKNHQIIIVTSGAIIAGQEHLGYPMLPNTIISKQLFAAVGQSHLIQLWARLFLIYGIHVGQMLLTRADIENRERFLNARNTLQNLLNNRIIPIINENDAVATTEIKVGDNDNLSALVAILADADKLLLLTDIEGLYTADPYHNSNAKLITEVYSINHELKYIAGDSTTYLGTGGMITKLQAASIAGQAGIEVIIAAGNKPNVIKKILNDQQVGTKFHCLKNPMKKRKQWIFGAPLAGNIIIDKGAALAIQKKSSSLLPKGIMRINGNFSRGDVVSILDLSGEDLAHGVTHYNSDALRLISKCHSREINQILGYEYGSVAIHRDDMIVSKINVKKNR